MQHVLKEIMDQFVNKPFLRHQAQAFPQFSLAAAYAQEENDFTKSAKTVPLCEIPSTANIISSHVLYKIKVNDDLSLKQKALIAPYRNEHCIKYTFKSDCFMCPPAGLRIVSSIASPRQWRLTKIDVKTAFL